MAPQNGKNPSVRASVGCNERCDCGNVKGLELDYDRFRMAELDRRKWRSVCLRKGDNEKSSLVLELPMHNENLL